MSKVSLRDLGPAELSGRTVLVRADLNVPMEDGCITDDTRVRESLATIHHLHDAGARSVVVSHFGRPKGPEPAWSLRPVAARLGELIHLSVRFEPELVGPGVTAAVAALEDGGILVLENTRFDPRETKNDPALAAGLAELADVFVNDAFGAAHRAHASTTAVAEEIRRRGGRAVAGLLMEKEISMLGRLVENPERPFVAILGGAKVSGKADVIRALLGRVDRLLVGGAMANTFFKAMGLEVGASLVEEDRVAMARELMRDAGDRLLLPVDCVVADRIDEDAIARVVPRDSVAVADRIGDIGPVTRRLYAEALRDARTVVWTGPMGVFEMDPFREGTVGLARAVADATDRGAFTVVGGGDSAAAAEAAGVADRLSHVSTGGGASLEFLAGEPLPGVIALSER
ncbi:MAG: phosphoglycerate kinase [Gemmatimonadetes bacterium]|nr:phosphoglycerate kinase [Gemmatimonadota bacterium]